MIITGDRQHLSRTDNPNYLEHMMLLYAECSGARTIKRTTYIQPVASRIEFRTVVPTEMLSHPPATPLCRSSRSACFCTFNSLRFRGSTRYAPTSPTLPRIVKTINQIHFVTVKVTLATGMLMGSICIGRVPRGEGDGGGSKNVFDDSQSSSPVPHPRASRVMRQCSRLWATRSGGAMANSGYARDRLLLITLRAPFQDKTNTDPANSREDKIHGQKESENVKARNRPVH